MATKTSCDTCLTTIADSDKLHCDRCATSCTECEAKSKRLLCPECAEDEFGTGGDDDPEADEDDVIAFIEHAVITDDVGDLAAAIRRGDMRDAEHLLDKIAREVPGWSDRISISRYSPRAKAA